MKIYPFSVPHTIEDYNSNNSWGFGGSRGKKITFSPECHLIVGWAGTRHSGEFAHTTLWWKCQLLDFSGNTLKTQAKVEPWVKAIVSGTIKITEHPNGAVTYSLP